MTTFNELGLSKVALKAVDTLGYTEPTPVQEQAIPLVIEGRDIIAAAKTGTGKTAAFSLPTMDRLGHVKGSLGPRLLVITPTRELAQQIGETCEAIASSTHHRVLTVVGGLSYEPQIKRLKRGVDVLIATPGRLIDLMDQHAVHLDEVGVLVLDEADRMLDMGFWPSVKKIVAKTPASRQTLLFSATIDGSVRKNVGNLLRDPATVEIAHKGDTADTVEQYVYHVPHNMKFDLLNALLKEKGSQRVIVFARTRSRADSTCRRLKRAGYTAEAIHSDRTQNQRRRALDNFTNGTTDVIVATDVLARGIDVEEVSYVVNFDLPMQPEDYVHRIGRTGRAGANGFSVSFVSPETAPALRDIEKFIKKSIPELEISSFDPETAAAEAAARATRHAAKNDPELAQAAKELAKREKKKQKAREEAAEGKAAPAKNGGKGRGKAKKQGQPSPRRSAAASQRETVEKTAKQPVKANRNSATSSKAKPAAGKRSAAPQKSASSRSSDMRPGRAHRAQLAQQRSKSGRGAKR